jgi:DNA invertase Pin-like site-specific DNA recombinase
MRNRPRTAIYCRVASADSAGIRAQEEALKDYAAANGFAVAGTFSDSGASGLTLDRPAFNRMMRGIERGEIGRVIVKDISRISRSFSLFQGWLEEMAGGNVKVIDVSSDSDAATANTRLIRAFRSGKMLANPTVS